VWQKKRASLLLREIESVLEYLPDAEYRSIVRVPLTKSRRGLGSDRSHDKPWPLLPLIICEAICGQYERALPVTAALQFMISAGDVFDDIEDADCSDSLLVKYGPAIATNVATTLIMLAERAVTRLKDIGIKNNTIIHVLNSINSYYIKACVGQHLDLSIDPQESISENLYLKIASLKSASQVECACQVGALLATKNQKLVRQFSLFGQNLGMAAQITNDIQGVITGSDITQGKMSLPVVYALNQTDDKSRSQLKQIFKKQKQVKQISDPVPTRNLLFHTGAVHYSIVKMEIYKQQATDILCDVENERISVEQLGLFLE
jgi:geranylgeranyl diphosphate synthase type I